jgi:hypothetical protein
MEKKTRHKRAAKEEPSPPKVKRIKVSQEHVELYDKFVVYGQKLKRAKRGQKATEAPLVLYHDFFLFHLLKHFSHTKVAQTYLLSSFILFVVYVI